MFRSIAVALLSASALLVGVGAANVQGQEPYGRTYSTQDWNRFYHYPYVYYPQNFWGPDYYRSSQDMYHRYPPEMQIPVYNKQWHSELPQKQKYYKGHHFVLDVF
jgi:hypothetical protein